MQMSKLIKFIHRASLLLAIEMSISCGLSYRVGYAIGNYIQHNTAVISALWCMISAILVMQASWSKSLESGASRIIGSFVGSLMGGCSFFLLGLNLTTYCIGVFWLVLILCYARQEPYLRLAILTMSVIFVAGTINPASELVRISISRLFESVIGIMITLVIRFITIDLHKTVEKLAEKAD